MTYKLNLLLMIYNVELVKMWRTKVLLFIIVFLPSYSWRNKSVRNQKLYRLYVTFLIFGLLSVTFYIVDLEYFVKPKNNDIPIAGVAYNPNGWMNTAGHTLTIMFLSYNFHFYPEYWLLLCTLFTKKKLHLISPFALVPLGH